MAAADDSFEMADLPFQPYFDARTYENHQMLKKIVKCHLDICKAQATAFFYHHSGHISEEIRDQILDHLSLARGRLKVFVRAFAFDV